MRAFGRHGWLLAALLAGVTYFVIGRAFAVPTHHQQAWRLAAWAVSGIVFAAHIAYEQFRCRSSPAKTALHVSLGAAFGAFLLGLIIAIQMAWTPQPMRPSLLLAPIAFPLITGVPAFVVALVIAAVLARLPSSRASSSQP